MFKRCLVVIVCAIFSLSALAGAPTNVAGGGQVYAGSFPSTGLGQSIFGGNDGKPHTQVDFTGWIAQVWADDARVFDYLLVEQAPGGQTAAWYQIWIAAPGVTNPDPATNEDWVLLSEFNSGVPGTSYAKSGNGIRMSDFGLDVYDPSLGTTGVRLTVLDDAGGGGDGKSRLREIWAFQNFSNVVSQATVTAPGWNNVGRLTDEATTVQCDTSNLAANPYIYATFAEGFVATLDGCMLVGGSGADGEHMPAYELQYRDLVSGKWETALTVSGNKDKVVWSDFAAATATEWRFYFDSAATSDNYGRVSEIMLFGTVAEIPEPATMTLLALGGLALLRRRSR